MQVISIAKEAEVSLDIQKSQFIAFVFPVNAEEEAKQRLASMKKRHPGATHHCYAYIIGAQQELQKSNDDGEPSGTAGRPILETLKKRKLTNTLAVVTRYFGGILLGTGGLIRAYTHATSLAVEKAGRVMDVTHINIPLRMTYADWGKIAYLIEQHHLLHTPPVFTDVVTVDILLAEEAIEPVIHQLQAITHGQIQLGQTEKKMLPIPLESD